MNPLHDIQLWLLLLEIIKDQPFRCIKDDACFRALNNDFLCLFISNFKYHLRKFSQFTNVAMCD